MKGFAVCLLLLFLCLGGLAAGVGFSALHTSRSTEYRVLLVNDVCIYPDSPAQTSGILAGLILLLAQILVIISCGCTCGWNNKKQVEGWNATMVGVGCLLGCLATGLGAAFFTSGSALSRPAERNRVRHKTNTAADCQQPKFTVAIGMLFCAVFLGVVFFVGIIREERQGSLTTPLPDAGTSIALPELLPSHADPTTPPP